MSGRHAGSHRAERRRRRSGMPWVVALVALALVAGAGATYAIMRGSKNAASADSTCTGPRISVAAAPEIAAAVTKAVAGCDRIDVTAAPSAAVAAKVAAGKDQPDVWIPDSSLWLAQVTAAPQTPSVLVRSVATSPVVLVTGAGTPPAGWAAALADPGLLLGDPLTSTAAATAIVAGASNGATDKTAELVVPLAQKAAATPGRAPDDAARLSALLKQRHGVTAVSEQEWLSKAPELPAAVPAAGTLVLDYPALLTTPAERRADIEATTDRLTELLATTPGQSSVFTAAGFRDTRANPPAKGVGPVRPITVSADAAGAALRHWATLALPTRSLAVVDVSGSMEFDAGGRTRLELTSAAATQGLGLFPDTASIGVWAFSQADGGQLGGDHRELLPIRRLSAEVGGTTQKALIAEQLANLATLTGGGTSLYDTTLAAYKAVQQAYDPAAANSVLLFTDGANDDPGSISLAQLLDWLHRLADPARPVRIIAIGISADADKSALEAIARATGGQAYVARRPQDIGTVFLRAISART